MRRPRQGYPWSLPRHESFKEREKEKEKGIRMYLTNMDNVPGYRIQQALGLCMGSTIRAKHVGKDIAAGFKQIVGGELRGYTEMMDEARNEALQRMMANAQSMGANAVLNVRFMTSSVMQAASEILAYGTAVILAPEQA